MTAIEWTDRTWNPTTGCSKVSPGCAHCYAETLSLRFGWSQKPWTPENAVENVVLHPERLNKPLTWRKPSMVFVNSMSDLFHELIPDDFICDVFSVMQEAEPHTFQVLTKRPERARDFMRGFQTVPSNVWIGTSIENDRWTVRADALRDTPAAVRFISAEPLLGPLPSLDLTGIDWLIVGGESGNAARPVSEEWVRQLRDACLARAHRLDDGLGDEMVYGRRPAFFFKQWGGKTPKSNGRILDGREWSEYPA